MNRLGVLGMLIIFVWPLLLCGGAAAQAEGTSGIQSGIHSAIQSGIQAQLSRSNGTRAKRLKHLQISPRIKFTINDGWRYAPGPIPHAETGRYDDSRWIPVTLPHTWNAVDAFDEKPGYRRGVGWYRKRLDLDKSLRGKRLYLYFEGANQVADVFVNGRHAGQHIGGYTAFAFDVTDLLTFDGPNVIAVKVNNRHDENIPPLDADFTFYGGIYRDVWLLATEPIHIEVLNHASPGVFIDTPNLSRTSGRVRIRGTVVNDSETLQEIAVSNRILSAENEPVTTLETSMTITAGERDTFHLTSSSIPQPRLWSPATPYLYRVVTEVHASGRLVDRTENPLGFRWFRVDPQEGFFLNGESLDLEGTNRHQDLPGYGNAVPDRLAIRDLRLIKRDGFNFLRLAHYPQDPVILREADRQGLLIWEEIPVVNTITMSHAFAANAARRLREMILQHYNHPSVVMWGYMNEILLREPDPRPKGYRDAVVALGRRLDAIAHMEDPFRLTTTAISYGEIDNGTGFQSIPDILGLNLYFGWYYEEPETLGAFLDSLHARHPDRSIFISEYGAGSDERIHAYGNAERFDFTSEYAQLIHRTAFAQIQKRPYLAGSAVWNQFDFGSAHRQDTKDAVNQKGLYFFDRTPKDVAFYYRAKLRNEPVLHIADEWRHRAGSRPKARWQPVWVYSNLDAVELFVNGESMGTRPVENAAAAWEVPLKNGVNQLLARGAGRDTSVIDECEISYADRTHFFADPASQRAVFAVNVGAHEQFIDAAGIVWEADQPYTPGSWGFVVGRDVKSIRTHHRIRGTQEDALYQTARIGMSRYQFDVPDGVYEVRLLFSENQHKRPKQRIFTVAVGSGPAPSRPAKFELDLAGTSGRYVAFDRAVKTSASGGDGISIAFSGGNPATLSGVLIRRM